MERLETLSVQYEELLTRCKAHSALLQEILAAIKGLSDQIAAERLDDRAMYSITQVCQETGISRHSFHLMWKKYRLNMPEPRITNNVRPRYSRKDIFTIKEILRNT